MGRLTVRDLAALPEGDRNEFMASLSDLDAEALIYDWRFWARDNQLPPKRGEWQRMARVGNAWQIQPGDGMWSVWAYLAGRGTGKTRSGAQFVIDGIKEGESGIMLVAPTAADARDTMVEGESGILRCSWEHDRTHSGVLIGVPKYEPSKRRLTWENGATASLYSAEEPERLRGPNGCRGWCDELAAWKYPRETWEMLRFCVRLGKSLVMITTTPKPIPVLVDILKDPLTAVSRGSTYENRANLSDVFIHTMEQQFEGTRIGRQELHAEILEDFPGALWKRTQLEECRVGEPAVDRRVVIGVDPAVTNTEKSDETGIVVASLGEDNRGYVLADLSGRYTPNEWAKTVVDAVDKYGADRVIAEGNNGGDLVRHTIETERRGIPIKIVHASRGKVARAEPISSLYEQGRVSHVGKNLELLEDQMATWEANSGDPSPDRVDALVWAMHDLMIRPPRGRSIGVAPRVVA